MATSCSSTIPWSSSSTGSAAGSSKITKPSVFISRKTMSYCKVKAVATSSSSRAHNLCASGPGRKKDDYYKVLSLERSAAVGAEEIKRAYRRLALQYHPDVCPPERRAESTELFLEVRRAYETLSDPAQRLRYDAELREEDEPGPAGVAFARDVWEAQLSALRARSEQRRQSKRSGAVPVRRQAVC